MFNGERYLTRGVNETIPFEIQLFLWEAINRMPEPKDYLQVFELSASDNMQIIHHTSEQPEFDMTYILPCCDDTAPINEKIYVIDDYYADEDKHRATMLLASEY